MTDGEFERYLVRVTKDRFPAWIPSEVPAAVLVDGMVHVCLGQTQSFGLDRHLRVLAFQLTEAADELQRRILSRP